MKGIGSWAAALVAIATCIIAIASILQYKITKATLQTFSDDLRLSNKPDLLLKGAQEEGTMFYVRVETDPEAGERWILPYFVENTSKRSAYGLQYYHETSNSEEMIAPNDSLLSSIWRDDIIMPGGSYQCGQDILYKSKVLDELRQGKRIFRHFVVRFNDEFGYEYSISTTWELYDYESGKAIQFRIRGYKML